MSNVERRCIPHDGDPPSTTDLDRVRKDIEDALVAGVQRVHRHITTKSGVYIGGPGLLLMDWALSDILVDFPDTLSTVPDMYKWFPFTKPTTGNRTGFLETDVGAATLILIHDLREGRLDVKRGTDRSRPAAILLREAIQVAVDGRSDDPRYSQYYQAQQVQEDEDDGCEVLYGRAGLLYTLLFLRSEVVKYKATDHGTPDPDAFTGIIEQLCCEQNIGALVSEIIARGKKGAKKYIRDAGRSRSRSMDGENKGPPLMWSWHGKRYLGAAHGIAGILHMLLCGPVSVVKEHWDAILQTVQWLLDIQSPSGNWPHKTSRNMIMKGSASSHEEDEIVHWCHGAPGTLILLANILRRYGRHSAGNGLEIPENLSRSMRDALARGGELVYSRGFLKKGVGLCHGVAGSVYALLAVSDAVDSADSQDASEGRKGQWFQRALHLAHLATEYEDLTRRGTMRIPDRPYSLYEGLAGMCCAWGDILRLLKADLLTNGDGMGRVMKGFPGFDDLRLNSEE